MIWQTRYIDDGYGDAGWFAYQGNADSMDDIIETGIYPTEAEALTAAAEIEPAA